MPASWAATITEISGRLSSSAKKQALSSQISWEGSGLLNVWVCSPHPAIIFFLLQHVVPIALLSLVSSSYPIVWKKKKSITVRLSPGFLSVSLTTAFVYFCRSSSILSLLSPILSLLLSSACFFLLYFGISNASLLLALLTLFLFSSLLLPFLPLRTAVGQATLFLLAWRLGTWFSGGLDSVTFTAGLNDIKGVLQPIWFYGSVLWFFLCLLPAWAISRTPPPGCSASALSLGQALVFQQKRDHSFSLAVLCGIAFPE